MHGFGLQFITDGSDAATTVAQARAAIAGGCRWVQVRLKDAPASLVDSVLQALAPDCQNNNVTLIVDDHVDLALKPYVDGVHLGQSDMPAAEARRILGPGKIIGLTVNNIGHADRAIAQPIEYVGLGPWRHTGTKKRLAPVLGPDGVEAIISRLRRGGFDKPITVIGGLTPDDVAPVIAAGADSVAVAGAIAHAEDPAAATRMFVERLQAAGIDI